jgi:hypothetical protein
MGLTDEMLLVKKLKELALKCGDPFNGVTTFEQRRETVRAAVKKLPHMLYNVKGVTLAEQFQRVYREEL